MCVAARNQMTRTDTTSDTTRWLGLFVLACLLLGAGCDRDGGEAPRKAPKRGAETPGGKAASPVPESTTGAPIDKLEAILESIRQPVDESEVDTYIEQMQTLRESDAFQSWVKAYEDKGSEDAGGVVSSESMRRHGLPLVRELAKHFESAPSVNTYPLVLKVGSLAVAAEYVAQREGLDEPSSDEVAGAMLEGQSAANAKFEKRRQAFADEIANPETSSSSDYAQALAQAPATAKKMAPLFVYGRLPRASLETWQGLAPKTRQKVLELADLPEAGVERSPVAASALSVEDSVETVLTYQLASAAEQSDGKKESSDTGTSDTE
jgi:hypothetical protein